LALKDLLISAWLHYVGNKLFPGAAKRKALPGGRHLPGSAL
jgi:hypothetical protein